MTLADRNHLIYATLRATVCGMMPSIIDSALESNGYSTMVSKSAFLASCVATQLFVYTRSSDLIENEIASKATLYASIGGVLGKWIFSPYFSMKYSSLVSDISAICLGSWLAIPVTSEKFIEEHDRRTIPNVRVIQ